jgi:nicotinamidase-related amidase
MPGWPAPSPWAARLMTAVRRIKMLFWSTVSNGALAPPLILLIILLTSHSEVMGKLVNPPVIRIMGRATFAAYVRRHGSYAADMRKPIPNNNHTSHASSVALILIDVINRFDFPDGKRLLKQALPIAPRLAKLKERCRRAKIPAIYVNDNFGQWRSDAKSLVASCLEAECEGKPFVEQIRPDDEDYFVLKPMHSAFFQTPLEVLLRYLGATTLILTGIATNSCIVCTAHDAKMRDFNLYVPSDCCAARTRREHGQSIEHIKEMACASILPSTSLRVAGLRGESKKPKA